MAPDLEPSPKSEHENHAAASDTILRLEAEIAERKRAEQTWKQTEEALHKRTKYLSCLTEISTELQMLKNLDHTLPQVLCRLREVSNADRCYIFENHTDASGDILTSQRFENCREGVAPQINNPELQNISYRQSGVGRWVQVMQNGNGAICGPVAEFPDSERQILEAQDIQWILVLPLRISQWWYGFIGFDACRAGITWTDQEITLLRIAANAISLAIQRKQAEEKIDAYQQQLRSLALQLSVSEERQKRRLATDLHDHIGQLLAVSQIKLGSLRDAATQAGLSEPLDEVRALLEQTIQYTRSLTFELSPPILYELGLEAATEWLLEQTHKQHGVAYEFEYDHVSKLLDEDIQALLFRAIRELLVNIAKHAQAGKVKSSIRHLDSGIQIIIEDDGIGFDKTSINLCQHHAGGFGLFNIRERLEHLGGQFILDSQPGRGTKVTLLTPLKEHQNTQR